jgi:LysM repeat protein
MNPGDSSGEATPVPIPNTEVKLSSAEDTERAAFRENRSSPGFCINPLPPTRRLTTRGDMLLQVTANPLSTHAPDGTEQGGLEPDSGRHEAPGVPPICPFLASGDGSWRSVQPTRSHVCAAVQPPAQLAASKQRQLCLGAQHAHCATFRAARNLLGTAAKDPLAADLWPRSVPRLMTLDPVRTGLGGGITTPQARAGGQALLIGLIVLAFVVLVVSRTTSPAGSSDDASPIPTGAASPSLVATPAPTLASGVPSAPPGAGGSAAPSVASGTTYTVQRGDTLIGIAREFGVTVPALRKANGLAKGAVLRRGQVLVIPQPVATPAP